MLHVHEFKSSDYDEQEENKNLLSKREQNENNVWFEMISCHLKCIW